MKTGDYPHRTLLSRSRGLATDGNVFSAYLNLTFDRLSMINPEAAYYGHFDISVVDALRKYDDSGFRYVNCATLGVCSTQWRTLHNGQQMLLDKSLTQTNLPLNYLLRIKPSMPIGFNTSFNMAIQDSLYNMIRN